MNKIFEVIFEETIRVEAETAVEAEEFAMEGKGVVVSREMTDNTVCADVWAKMFEDLE